ncbi:sugar ABC transporter substrate-binding protein [Paracoccus laeviglucosivorans]|uniref:Fructose transport system substrate-binding protein n=1 Tax=Paracoccus laeviglucosivorans TaxID=1197861 RepID=A0A521F071_9RHOB|nr:sugar ABC transporter substrate-binding protein [Paracoccus laeviglucosivorans]SMO89598.1 fructose transport system substrate-binding protein [Paracoccus laeviglucosivorans]
MKKNSWLALGGAVAALCLSLPAAQAQDKEILVGLITKTDPNPFFYKMREGAEAKSKELGVKFQAFAGKFDGDNDTQVQAVENLIAAGASGILIVASDTKAIVPTIQKARDAGILVIALDTPLEPMEAAQATFATDNFHAGQLIGEWAKRTLGDKAADAHIAFIDAHESQPTVDVARDQGFMDGFGIDTKDVNRRGDEDDPRIVGHEMGEGSEVGGRNGMETLLQKNFDVNVVYTINEPTAAGAWEALKAAGKDDGSVLVTSVDGGCPGVKNVADGVIGATSMQFPLLMASLGVEAIVEHAKNGTVPEPSEGLTFTNTGVKLVTDKPVEGLESITSEEALKECWG